MSGPIASDPIANERDVVSARLRALRLAQQLGFDAADQTRIATAVSEVARNALVHGKKGTVTFDIDHDHHPAVFRIVIADTGPGIADLDALLSGGSRGHGLSSARRLVDRFDIDTQTGKGTTVALGKTLPRGNGLTKTQLTELRKTAQVVNRADPVATVQKQNAELLTALSEERARQEELRRLSLELEDTNRGVVALHAELEEKAEHLRLASELKTRFLSNMSHEFRTPLSSILALTRLLLDQVDGRLQAEQVKQVTYIRQSAQELLELINDLLDLAKVEAGKLTARPTSFFITDLFGSLRGMLKPLQVRDGVTLTIEDPDAETPPLLTDEAKVAQILRNFITNALRFTKRGAITVSAQYFADRDFVEFSVQDTGIGIATVDQAVIFQEFTQVENPLQAETRGTGLGLPLSRRLAELLGGYILLDSTVGVGSTFKLCIPRRLEGAKEPSETEQSKRLLVIDDEDTFRYIVRQMVGEHKGLEIVEAKNGVEGLAKARHIRPDAIILDVLMPGMSGQDVLKAIRNDPNLERTAVYVFTSLPLTERLRAELMGATGILAKQDLSKDALRQILDRPLRLSEAS